MRPQILSGIHQRKEAVSMWIPVSFPTQTANSRASLCLRRRCPGRYLLYIYILLNIIFFHHKVTSCHSSESHWTDKLSNNSGGFYLLFFQVSFSSYKPTNYTSDDSEDHVDGCVKPYFPVFTSVLFEDSVESVFHMSRKQHSSSKL